jgi:hypothetical protein
VLVYPLDDIWLAEAVELRQQVNQLKAKLETTA